MPKDHVQKLEETYRIAGTRVLRDSLVYLFREGWLTPIRMDASSEA